MESEHLWADPIPLCEVEQCYLAHQSIDRKKNDKKIILKRHLSLVEEKESLEPGQPVSIMTHRHETPCIKNNTSIMRG